MDRHWPATGIVLLALCCTGLPAFGQQSPEVRVPDGFEATLYADDDLAPLYQELFDNMTDLLQIADKTSTKLIG